MILDEEGNVIRCDRCGKVHDFDHGDFHIKVDLWYGVIFKGIQRPNELSKNFCRECAAEVTPIVWQLRDVWELRKFVNKLRKEINERKKRDQDNRATA